MASLTRFDLQRLQQKLGYTFSNTALIQQAMTHRSFSAVNNERLEFLGDAILNLIIAAALYRQFNHAKEGQLSRLRAKLVKRQTLAEIARELHLGDFLIMGVGELKNGGYLRDSILSNAIEAIIGGIYLESGIEIAEERVLFWFNSRLDNLSLKHTFKDPKSLLQEYLQGHQVDLPRYEVLKVSGKSHQQTFTVTCQIDLLPKATLGVGQNRRLAEQNAATAALAFLGINDA